MKTLVVSVLLIAIAIATAFFIHQDAGEVSVVFQGQNFETTLGIALAAIAVGFIAFYIFARFFLGLLNAPKTIKKRGQLNRERKAHEGLSNGLMQIDEGNFETAENALLANMSENKTCDAATYIIAAKSANARNQAELSDTYLAKAVKSSPDAALPAGIASAEMLLQRHQYRDAVKKLSELRTKAPGNPRVIWLLAEAYKGVNGWENMTEVLKSARKKKAAPSDQILKMESLAAVGAISDAADGNVQAIFDNQPSHVQALGDVVKTYATRLNGMGKADEAAKAVSKALNADWNEDLAEFYGEIESSDASAQLEQAEKWSASNGESVALLLSLGNLSYRRSLWGKAKEYVVKSIGIKPTQQAFFALGKTLEAMDDNSAALEAYKHGYAVNNEPAPKKADAPEEATA